MIRGIGALVLLSEGAEGSAASTLARLGALERRSSSTKACSSCPSPESSGGRRAKSGTTCARGTETSGRLVGTEQTGVSIGAAPKTRRSGRGGPETSTSTKPRAGVWSSAAEEALASVRVRAKTAGAVVLRTAEKRRALIVGPES